MCLAHAGADAPSVLLVKAMRFDFATLDSTIWSMRRSVADGDISAAVYDCVSKRDHSIFTPLWAREVEKKLTAKEISASLKFYTSSAGRKYTEYGLIDSHNQFLGQEVEKYPSFSKSDEKAILKFGNSPVGKKLLSGVLSDPYPDAIAALQEQLVAECSK
jgi:hypothetical protein